MLDFFFNIPRSKGFFIGIISLETKNFSLFSSTLFFLTSFLIFFSGLDFFKGAAFFTCTGFLGVKTSGVTFLDGFLTFAGISFLYSEGFGSGLINLAYELFEISEVIIRQANICSKVFPLIIS